MSNRVLKSGLEKESCLFVALDHFQSYDEVYLVHSSAPTEGWANLGPVRNKLLAVGRISRIRITIQMLSTEEKNSCKILSRFINT